MIKSCDKYTRNRAKSSTNPSQNRMIGSCWAVVFATLILCLPIFANASGKIVTESVTRLGNPALSRYDASRIYARNVWDMKSWNDKIYLGQGDSVSNTGPVVVNRFNPSTNLFEQVGGELPTEQIERFRIVDGNLVVPSHDPKGKGSEAYYRYDGKKWAAQSLVNFAHCFDLQRLQGGLYASIGPWTGNVVMYRSEDDGKNWTALPVISGDPLNPAISTHYLRRSYGHFEWRGEIYCNITLRLMDNEGNLAGLPELGRVDRKNNKVVTLKESVCESMFADSWIPPKYFKRIEIPHVFLDQLVYIAAKSTYNLQWEPASLHRSNEIGSSAWIRLDRNATPWDIIVVEDRLYVLATLLNVVTERYWISVASTSDLETWVDEFRFEADTFARSFEYQDGAFYFGLGCTEANPRPAATGDILRYYDGLVVTPSEGFESTGQVGGPTTPSLKKFTLTNVGPDPLEWTASSAEEWTDVSPPSGTLGANTTVTVTVTPNLQATRLAAGNHRSTITFTNSLCNRVLRRIGSLSLSGNSGE